VHLGQAVDAGHAVGLLLEERELAGRLVAAEGDQAAVVVAGGVGVGPLGLMITSFTPFKPLTPAEPSRTASTKVTLPETGSRRKTTIALSSRPAT